MITHYRGVSLHRNRKLWVAYPNGEQRVALCLRQLRRLIDSTLDVDGRAMRYERRRLRLSEKEESNR